MVKRILIVEDDLYFQALIIHAIRMEWPEARFTVCENFHEARLTLRRDRRSEEPPFDLAIVDHYLPDGFGLALSWKPECRAQVRKFLLVSGMAESEYIAASLSLPHRRMPPYICKSDHPMTFKAKLLGAIPA